MSFKQRLLLSACVLAIPEILASAAFAQDATGEIVVTARKREESILKVPVVETAITSEQLESQQIDDIQAIADRVPGFVMGESVGTVGFQASLRGIGPTSQTATVDQSVSLNIDGLQLSQGHAFSAGMFDVAQIEVLKGPQALFFGKNSPAGVISMRSADPTDQFELKSRVGYEFEADEKLAEFIVSGPVTHALKLRLATRYSHSKGFFRNNGQPIPDLGSVVSKYRRFAPHREWIVRGTALFEPGPNYTARLKVNYVDSHMKGSGGDGQVASCPDGRGGVAPINLPFLQDSDCRLDRYTQFGDFDPAFWPGIRNDGVPFMDSYQLFGTLEQDLNLTDALTLTSVTGYYKMRQDNLIRGDGSSTAVIAADFRFRNRQFTQELRLTSDFTTPLNFTLGGFFQDGKMQVRNRLRGNAAFQLPPLLQSGQHVIDIKSVSLFGQALWKITPNLELAGGARWTDEKRQHTEFNALDNFNEVDLLVPRISASNISPEVSLTYTPTDDLTLFASYRQGFKSGSFNTVVFIDENTNASFGDEKAKGFEVGLKARTLDRSLNFNLAAYRYIYSDLQVGANDLAESGAIVLRTINAASAKVQGIEFDFTFEPRSIDGLTLRGAVNYNHARYKNFDNAPCGNGQTAAEGCNLLPDPMTGRFTSQDLSGRPLVRAPDWTASLGADYEFPLSNSLIFRIGGDANYSSDYFTNLVALRDYKQDEFLKVGGNITIEDTDKGWELALIGRNLSNQITTGSCANANIQNGVIFGGQVSGGIMKGPAGDDELFCVPERGREIWLRATFKLGG